MNYKREFKQAGKQLTNDRSDLLDIDTEISYLQRKRKELAKKVENDEENRRNIGLLYYDEARRNEIICKAGTLKYSSEAIKHLQSFDKEHWNADTVTSNDIEDFAKAEKYVSKYTSFWDNNIFEKFSKEVFGDCESEQ